MAQNAQSFLEVQTGGADTNAGGFSLSGNTYNVTDLACANARAANPVVTSATYTFVAGDVGHWLYITAGANWVVGLYKILSVSAGAATLSPLSFTGDTVNGSTLVSNISSFTQITVGSSPAFRFTGTGVMVNSQAISLQTATNQLTLGSAASATNTGVTLTAQVGTADSITGGSATIDRSQATAPFVALDGATIKMTNLSASATVTVTGYAASAVDVGNWVQVTGGTLFLTGWYQIVTVNPGASGTGAWTFDRNATSGIGASGAGNMGGCLLTLNQAGSAMVSSNRIWLRGGAYAQTATATMGAASVSPAQTTPYNRITGYNAIRGDILQVSPGVYVNASNRPTITLGVNTGLSGISTTNNGWFIEHVVVNCSALGTSKAINLAGSSNLLRDCKLINFTLGGILTASNTDVEDCEITGGTSAATAAFSGVGGNVTRCNIHDNACTAITFSGQTAVTNCQITNNTGPTSDGVVNAATLFLAERNTIYGCGRHGINCSTSSSLRAVSIRDNVLHTNGQSGTGYGLVGGTAAGFAANSNYDGNVYYNNATGTRRFADDAGAVNAVNMITYPNVLDILCTADPCVNVAGGDFRINNVTGGGALVRGQGTPGALPGASQLGAMTPGALQPALPGIFY